MEAKFSKQKIQDYKKFQESLQSLKFSIISKDTDQGNYKNNYEFDSQMNYSNQYFYDDQKPGESINRNLQKQQSYDPNSISILEAETVTQDLVESLSNRQISFIKQKQTLDRDKIPKIDLSGINLYRDISDNEMSQEGAALEQKSNKKVDKQTDSHVKGQLNKADESSPEIINMSIYDSELGGKNNTYFKSMNMKYKMTAKTIEDLSVIDDNTVSYIEYNKASNKDQSSFILNTNSQRNANFNNYGDLCMNTDVRNELISQSERVVDAKKAYQDISKIDEEIDYTDGDLSQSQNPVIQLDELNLSSIHAHNLRIIKNPDNNQLLDGFKIQKIQHANDLDKRISMNVQKEAKQEKFSAKKQSNSNDLEQCKEQEKELLEILQIQDQKFKFDKNLKREEIINLIKNNILQKNIQKKNKENELQQEILIMKRQNEKLQRQIIDLTNQNDSLNKRVNILEDENFELKQYVSGESQQMMDYIIDLVQSK